MVEEDELSLVLSEFARTLLTDFPIEGILDHLVRRIVEVVPVTGAGVTLISGGRAPHAIAASDEDALRFERLQSEMQEGPCLVAHESGAAVAIADLGRDEQFPRFGPAAVAAGLAAVFTFPLRHGAASLGALDLYRDTPGPLDRHDLAGAQTMADVAAAYLLNARARDEAHAASELLRHSSLHDPLTGLPNRVLLQERLQHAAERSRRSLTTVAVLFADLDRFKEVNDAHGHRAGDELLRAVAHRLSSVVRPGDTLARVAGDEFVFVCEDMHSPADAAAVAERIHEALATPFLVGECELTITASVGVAFAGPGCAVPDDLVATADAAMYADKRRHGRNHDVIDRRQPPPVRNRHGAASELRAAFAGHELDIAYQPIVCAVDGRVTGAEALLRWTHPRPGNQSTSAMVHVAERSGLIVELGAWILERSCREREGWLREHPEAPVDVAVNLSVSQLMSRDLIPTVTSVLARTGMDPQALILEVTEHSLIDDSEVAKSALAALKDLGIQLALDDFGSGYASLRYLLRFPLDIVKLDQGFIVDIDAAPTSSAVLAAVTNLAHVLGLTVIAEGVETERQHDLVNAVGCECAQGFFYAHPMPAAHLGARIGEATSAEGQVDPVIRPPAPPRALVGRGMAYGGLPVAPMGEGRGGR